MDPYTTLGVAPDATDEDIKAAYRRLAMEHHPDREGGDKEAFQRIQEAYATLCDPEKRAAAADTSHMTDDERAAAMALESMFETVLTQHIDAPDIVAKARQAFNAGRQMLEIQLRNERENLRRLQAARGRHRFDPKRTQLRANLLARQLEARIGLAERRVASAERECRVLELSLGMLDAFEDPKPEAPPANQVWIGTVGSSIKRPSADQADPFGGFSFDPSMFFPFGGGPRRG